MSTFGTLKPIALVGAPNSGKTTLYNWITGSKFKTVNYPGATVEYSIGKIASRWNLSGEVMDTPGTYSLFPKSSDEEVTVKALFSHPEYSTLEKVIIVVDGTQLDRHLILVEQIKRAGFSCVVALTMADLLENESKQIDIEFLESYFKVPFVKIDGRLGGGVKELLDKITSVQAATHAKAEAEWSVDEIQSVREKHIDLVKKSLAKKSVANELNKQKTEDYLQSTLKFDRIFLHPFFGFIIFILIMSALFASIYWIATPFMDLIDQGFSTLGEIILSKYPDTLWSDFVANGLIASLNGVLIFIPQIFILFFGIGILESTGYLARAATLIDKPFSKIGLSGRSFVPVLSGFACAVPALIATRNLSSKRDRLITAFIVPLMTCSARLPVYALLIGFLFKDDALVAGFVLALIYISALLIGAMAAGIVNKILPKGQKSYFMMELPYYRAPQWRVLLTQALHKTKSYVTRAGPVIFVLAILLWGAVNFPNYSEQDSKLKLEQSYAGQVGQYIEPLFKPMGVDWRVGVGLISAFAAREVFVSSLAIVFNIADSDEDSINQKLLLSMEEAKFTDGTPIFTLGSVLGLIAFFTIALQCLSTVGVAYRETGSAKFASFQLVVFNLFAYVVAVVLNNLF